MNVTMKSTLLTRRRGVAAAAPLVAALLLLTGCQTPASNTPADAAVTTVTFSAAASLTDLGPELISAYAKDTGSTTRIQLNLGSSAQLVQQANADKAPDVLITADTPAIDGLERPGEFDRLGDVASNKLVLAVPAGSTLASAAELPADATVALCAPSVPCGRAAASYLDASGLKLNKPSEEDNVRAVLTKLTSGQVDAGFVYATDATAAGEKVKAIALDGLAPNIYPLLISKTAPAGAREFGTWLEGDAAGALFEKAGFERP